MSRRAECDLRQVEKWAQRADLGGMWRMQLLRQCQALNLRKIIDGMVIDPVLQQSCHHWAYELTQKALEAYWAELENMER